MNTMTVMKVLVLVTIMWAGVKAVCEEKVLKLFEDIWKGQEPEKIMDSWVGKTTHLWASPAIEGMLPGMIGREGIVGKIACYQTVVDSDRVSTRDYVTFVNNSLAVHDYYLVMERPGRVSLIQDKMSDILMYVVYMKNGVVGYFMCDPDYRPEFSLTPGVGIKVVNYDKNSKDQSQSIQAAKDIFTKLKLNDGVDLGTKCPAKTREGEL